MTTVQVCSRRRKPPYFVQVHEDGEWRKCPGEWLTLADARAAAETCAPADARRFRVISEIDLRAPDRRVALVRDLKTYQLERRGLVRLGTNIEAVGGDDLDRMWCPSRVKRAHAERMRLVPPERNKRPDVGMLRILRLEFIGHDLWSALRIPKMRPWVAGVNLDVSESGTRVLVTARTFAKSHVDYSDADKTGGRGVRLCYNLQQGYVYEAFDRARPLGPRRVYITHDGQCWHDLTGPEACYAQGHARLHKGGGYGS